MEPRFKSKRKNCRIEEQDSDSEGVLGGTAASSRHYAEVRVRGKQVEEMHGKDIRNSEELKSQKQKQSQYQKKYGPDAERQDDGREQRDYKLAVAAEADLQHARMGTSSPRPSGKASSSTSTSLTRPVRMTQFSQ